ncbi:hypothetical protein P3T76_015292 [Phytophthora citrophthora]|uniref:Elicitin n=1 Tax=Phytophthora citrophthora TaxID=4793 RepID=A0AAD9FZL8_9STRA|nr:hypothetical protein P3T76_015290 [Phytophthora citrophthora]KAK1929164.1 hypothetical protein P3T76_015292 [Phytophthora citrophthora]
MKTSALPLLVIIALSSSTVTFAADCTADDLTTISSTYSDAAMNEGAAKCPDLTKTKTYCDASDCLDYMTNLLNLLPDCTSDGVNIRAGLQSAIDVCKTGTSDVAKGSASSSSSHLRSSSSSSDSSATVSSSSTGSTTSDQENEITAAPSAGGSSSASSINVAISTTALAMAAFVLTGAL